MAVTDAQYNAGKILINIKLNELANLNKKLSRVGAMVERVAKCKEMPYTEENMLTLLQHSLAALLSGNMMMIHFWMSCTVLVHEELNHHIRLEYIRMHQANRIGDIADRISGRVTEIDGEIKAIIARLNS